MCKLINFMYVYVYFWYILKIVLKKLYLWFFFSNFRIKVVVNVLDREVILNIVELVMFIWWFKFLELNLWEYIIFLFLIIEMVRVGLFWYFIVFLIILVILFESVLLLVCVCVLVV